MQVVAIATILCITLCGYLATIGLPGAIKFAPELLSVIVAVYVVLAGARMRFQLVSAKYWLVFGALLFTALCGIVINSVETGPIIAGMRSYLRAIPFFFLPALFAFSERQLRQQLLLLLALCLLQLPLAGWQRWQLMSQHRFTGDLVTGTLLNSGHLTIVSICAALIVIGLFMRDRMRRKWAFLLFFILLLPTTINETKVTVFLLPLGLIATLMVGAPKGRRLPVAAGALTLIIAFGAIFIPVYNKMQENNPYPQKIGLDLITDQKRNYMTKKNADVGATGYVGRFDTVTLPVAYLQRDPIHLAFGLGVGNVSQSSLGSQFSGAYFSLFEYIAFTTFPVLLLELGVLGTSLAFLLYWLIFRDAVALARLDRGMHGGIAVGWVGVCLIITVTTFYTTLLPAEGISYLFWYFSGLIAARRMQLSLEAHAPQRAAGSRLPVLANGT